MAELDPGSVVNLRLKGLMWGAMREDMKSIEGTRVALLPTGLKVGWGGGLMIVRMEWASASSARANMVVEKGLRRFGIGEPGKFATVFVENVKKQQREDVTIYPRDSVWDITFTDVVTENGTRK